MRSELFDCRRAPLADGPLRISAFFRTVISCVLTGLLLSCFTDRLAAQPVTVQEPTVHVLSGATTVSVPDRGGTLLGGVGRGASSRSTQGPFPMNTNYGSSYEGTSARVHARIHDFAELDRQALEAADGHRRHDSGTKSTTRAGRAWERLHERHAEGKTTAPPAPLDGKVSAQAPPGARQAKPDRGGSLSAEELYRKGIQAEAAGQRGVALLFLRQARIHGSRDAERKLEAMADRGTATPRPAQREIRCAGSSDVDTREIPKDRP